MVVDWEGLLLESRLTVRTGAGAAVGVVTEGVDVHATLGVGVVAGDVPGDLGLGGLGGLLEGDGALDVGVTTDNSDCEKGIMSAIAAVCTSPRQPPGESSKPTPVDERRRRRQGHCS